MRIDLQEVENVAHTFRVPMGGDDADGSERFERILEETIGVERLQDIVLSVDGHYYVTIYKAGEGETGSYVLLSRAISKWNDQP